MRAVARRLPFDALAIAALSIVALAATEGCALDRSGLGAGSDAGAGIDAGRRIDGGGDDPDGGPACTPGSCDDGNPCTDDTCDPGTGCRFLPVPGACDDGVLCNGADSCMDGACSAHDGVDPCPGASTCDAATDMCVGCATDADCPGEMPGPWGPCSFGPTDPCATTGTRSRTVTSYACGVDGTCTPSTRTETEACTRATDGAACGAGGPGPWSACSYASGCATSGSRTRTVSSGVCSGGMCTTSTTVEVDTAGCARATDGMACAAPSAGPWGPCGGFSDTCDTTGTQSRTVTTAICSGGACGATTMTTETQACTRDTEGTACSAETCGDWTVCFPAASATSACSGSGTQYRGCSAQRCVGGACSMGPIPRPESRACTLGPAGAACVSGVSCGACYRPGGPCPRGGGGIMDCTVTIRSCNPSLMCTGTSSSESYTAGCTCP